MAATGTWTSHIKLAARLLKVDVQADGRSYSAVDIDESIIKQSAVAIRDLGDRLDAALELVRLQEELLASLSAPPKVREALLVRIAELRKAVGV